MKKNIARIITLILGILSLFPFLIVGSFFKLITITRKIFLGSQATTTWILGNICLTDHLDVTKLLEVRPKLLVFPGGKNLIDLNKKILYCEPAQGFELRNDKFKVGLSWPKSGTEITFDIKEVKGIEYLTSTHSSVIVTIEKNHNFITASAEVLPPLKLSPDQIDWLFRF